MRFAHLSMAESPDPQLCVVSGDDLIPVAGLFPDAPRSLNALIRGGDEMLDRVRDALQALPAAGTRIPIGEAQFAPAVIEPPVIFAIGLNYAAHSSELGLKADTAPTVFTLWQNSLAGHGGTTWWPRELSEAVDYEAELGFIIGRPGRDIPEDQALEHVWGYTVVNDITARNVQFSEAQWCRCKSFDGFTPVGPVIVTADEIPDPQALRIWTVLDGHTLQDGSTGQMIRPVSKLIAHLSTSTTLLPGSLVSTGSPGGAGYSREPQIFMRDRSTVTVGIEGIGELTTHCRIREA